MSFDVRAHIEAHPQIDKLSVREREVATGVLEGAIATIEPVVRDLVAERDRLREALLQTVDLCNALREYAPTLNAHAEKRLRESLALAAPSDDAAPPDAAPANQNGPSTETREDPQHDRSR